MKVPFWYLMQLLAWLVTGVPAYVIAALWGRPDWWLFDNLFNSDLAVWEVVLFSCLFAHPLLTLPFAVTSSARRNRIA